MFSMVYFYLVINVPLWKMETMLTRLVQVLTGELLRMIT